MTDAKLHCSIEIHRVTRCRSESFFILLIVHCLLFELGHTAHEDFHTVRAMEDAIRFIEVAEKALDLITQSAWPMLFIEMILVSPRSS